MQQHTRKKCMFNCVIFIFLMYICISGFPSSRKGLFKTVLYFHFMVCGVTQSVFLALLISKILCCSFVDRLLLKLQESIFCVATTTVHVLRRLGRCCRCRPAVNEKPIAAAPRLWFYINCNACLSWLCKSIYTHDQWITETHSLHIVSQKPRAVDDGLNSVLDSKPTKADSVTTPA